MAFLARPDGVVIHHESHAPQPHGATFVFFNPLTGDSGMWLQRIAPALEARGHGWLVFDLRGQKESPVAPTAEITVRHIVEDAKAVIEAEAPVRPIYVGLSIGGLFAANVHMGGSRAKAMLLINTLREEGPRLAWLNEALARCARTGGLRLLRDLYLPLLFGERWLAANRDQFLAEEPYIALDPAHADVRLLASASTADWNLPWEKLDLPVIVMTGRQDRVFYDEEVVRRLAARLPNALRVDLAEAGHLIPAEDPEAVVEACLALAGRIGEPLP